MKNRRHFLKQLLAGTSVLFLQNCKSKMPAVRDNGKDPFSLKPGMDLYGVIQDEEGAGIKGVVVSDGYTCTVTDLNGVYQMKKRAEATFVFYSPPSNYEVNTSSDSVKMASFYANIVKDKVRYDFKLKKIAHPETDFTLLGIGDPQPHCEENIDRFARETMSDIHRFVNSCSSPVYGLVLGDMVSDIPDSFPVMKKHVASTKMKVFITIGNHDKVPTNNSSDPRTGHVFSRSFGPLDYSFNRGDVHFVCLDNVVFHNGDIGGYKAGFSESQIEWLKQDLSYVSKDKMIILFYHIPLFDRYKVENRDEIMALLAGFSEVHLMSAHTHYNKNVQVTSSFDAYEHIHGTACGAWWHSVINGDGTPNGYAVYEISGAKIKNWYYKSVNYDRSHQLRLYRGSELFSGEHGSFSFEGADDMIIANVWNADDQWALEVYEDGQLKGSMERLSPGSDMWSKGYHAGVLNFKSSIFFPETDHLYGFKLSNAKASVKVVAIDRFNNKYTETEFVSDVMLAGKYSS